MNRNVATHAAGVVIADRKLQEVVPLYKDASTDLLLPSTQFDMYSAEDAGLIKFDFLGLKTLTVINNTQKLIKKKEKDFNPSAVILEIVGYSLKQDYKSVEGILIELYLSGIQLTSLMDDYIEPVLVSIQNHLDDKKISVAEEHIARKIVSKGLGQFKLSVINTVKDNGISVLTLNLENDIPDLPIDMIQILLEDQGYNVHNCGSHTSIKDIKSLLSKKNYEAIFIYLCDRQCCTSTLVDNIDKTNSDLEQIVDLSKKYDIKFKGIF